MPNYNSSYTGQQIDSAVQKCLTADGNGGIADKNWVNNLMLTIFPVGAIYETTTDTNPGTFIGGTWNCIASMPKRITIGSQCIWSGPTSGTGPVSKTAILGAYDRSLITSMFVMTEIPSGWHQEFKLSAQITAAGNSIITLYLNNIATAPAGTWSATTFRRITASNYFIPSDIILTTTLNYSNPGTNLYYAVTGDNNAWSFYNVTISAFLTSDTTYYTWQRTD